MKKEDLTLFDLWMSDRNALLGPTMRQAKRFVLDASASEFVGELLRRAPLEVLRQHQFAKAPYETTWIELDHEAYFQRGLQLPTKSLSDSKVGILVHHDRVRTIACDAGGSAMLSPMIIDLHRKVTFEEELEIAQAVGASRFSLRMLLLGGVTAVTSDWWQSAEAAEVCRSHRLSVDKAFEHLPTPDLAALLAGSAGDLKMMLALLLLLVRPHSNIVSQEVGHRRAIVGGKAMVLKEHHVLKLRLDHADPVTRYLSHLSTGGHRREHGVRGHWAQHRKRGRNCGHQWEGLSPTLFQCVVCGAKRWWKKDHHRGKGGRITKEYEVTR